VQEPSEPPTWGQVREAAEKFEQQWLGAADLPRPKAFVYCCPHPLASPWACESGMRRLRSRHADQTLIRTHE
jgi:hypothetical protein